MGLVLAIYVCILRSMTDVVTCNCFRWSVRSWLIPVKGPSAALFSLIFILRQLVLVVSVGRHEMKDGSTKADFFVENRLTYLLTYLLLATNIACIQRCYIISQRYLITYEGEGVSSNDQHSYLEKKVLNI